MALQVLDDDDDDQNKNNKPTFKHFCKICKRGFGCGRALGGHMRAHGIGAEADVDIAGNIDGTSNIREDSSAGTTSDWVDEDGKLTPPRNKRMYALRTNTNRLKSGCRVCENCGLEFSSWRSFLEHGKCNNVENTHNNNNTLGSDEEDGLGGWSKGKRSKRSKFGSFLNLNCPMSEEEDLANCLVMLSSARVGNNHNPLVLETEESCSVSASKEEEDRKPEIFMPKFHDQIDYKAKGIAISKGLFECKACKKVFNSHQALGGHRASHKKVKGCYAAKNDNNFDETMVEEDIITNDKDYLITSKSTYEYEPNDVPPVEKRKSKVHECSICHRIFSSGQALGGHKRCHWVTSSNSSQEHHHKISAATTSSVAFHHQFNDQRESFNIHQRVPKFNDQPHNKPLHDLNLSVKNVDDIKGMQKDFDNVDTRIGLQPWISLCGNENIDNHNDHQNKNNSCDEANDSKVKLAKLSHDLKDDDSSTTSWLQVGIGSSTSNVGKDLNI